MFSSRLRVRSVAAAVTAAAVLTAVAACAPTESPSTGEGGAITVGQTGDIVSLDPIIDSSLQGINAFDTIYDQLTEVLRDGSVGPRIATEWTSNDDATVWDFTLRDDIVFSDGTPLTAEDVIFTFEQVKSNPESRNTNYLAQLETMEVLEGNVLRFNLSAPFANWPRQMTLLSIVPKAAYEAAGGSDGFIQAPVGSGPYEFVSYSPGVSLVVQAKDDYWGDAPTLEQITFVPVTTDEGRVSGVQSGSLDLALVPPTQVPALEGSSVDVRGVGSNQTMYLGFNSSEGATADPRIRQAISLAVDRQAIVDTILGGLAAPANQMSSPANFGYDPDRDPYAYDVAAAQALMSEAGYDGEVIPLNYALDGWIPLGSQVAQAVGGYLEQAGFTVELRGVDAATYTLMGNQKEYEGVYFSAYGPSYLDAQIILNFGIGPLATRYFESPEIDELYALQISETDEPARADYIAQIWDEIDENTYFAALYNPEFNYAVSPSLNWEPLANGSLFFAGATLSE